MPKVSFLLPVYNGAAYLAETLASLQAQDHDDYDVVVIDDGSTDQTPDIVAEFATRSGAPSIQYHRRAQSGLVDTLNHGLTLLDCDFVARIDADDVCLPSRLSQQLDFIAFTGAAAVSARSLHIDAAGQVLGLSGLHNHFDADPRRLPAAEPYLPHPFLLARLDVLAKLGFRHAHLAEDADLCWRLAERWPIAMQKAVLGRYRLHDASVSTQSAASVKVQAFYSQVSALNAVRREEGQDEVPYDASMAEALAAGTQGWDALIALLRHHLLDDEAPRLRAAAMLKLLDVSEWRGYTPTVQDMTDAASALRDIRGANGLEPAVIDRLFANAAQTQDDARQNSQTRGFGERIRGFLRRG
ncbi:MAG: glycosyltransferase family 2 protein [Pseudomonadota bacterium]